MQCVSIAKNEEIIIETEDAQKNDLTLSLLELCLPSGKNVQLVSSTKTGEERLKTN